MEESNTAQPSQGGTAALLQRRTDSEDVGPVSGDSGSAPFREPETHDASLPSRSTDEGMPLLNSERAAGFQERWEAAQRGFVDEPRVSVQRADELVADVIRDLAEQFASERARLEGQWGRGDDVSTEDLRVALQRYRSFFNRLLHV